MTLPLLELTAFMDGISTTIPTENSAFEISLYSDDMSYRVDYTHAAFFRWQRQLRGESFDEAETFARWKTLCLDVNVPKIWHGWSLGIVTAYRTPASRIRRSLTRAPSPRGVDVDVDTLQMEPEPEDAEADPKDDEWSKDKHTQCDTRSELKAKMRTATSADEKAKWAAIYVRRENEAAAGYDTDTSQDAEYRDVLAQSALDAQGVAHLNEQKSLVIDLSESSQDHNEAAASSSGGMLPLAKRSKRN